MPPKKSNLNNSCSKDARRMRRKRAQQLEEQTTAKHRCVMSDLEVSQNNKDEVVSAMSIESRGASVSIKIEVETEDDMTPERKVEVETEDDLTPERKASWGNLENLELDFESDVNVKENDFHKIEENHSEEIVKQEELKKEECKEIKKEPEDTDEGEISDSDVENGEENESGNISKNAKDNRGEDKKELENKDEGEISDDNDLEEGELGEDATQLQNKWLPADRQICRFFNRGQCFYGVGCRFLHMKNNSLHGNYTMFPNTFRENVKLPVPFVRKNTFPRRGAHFGTHFNEKENTNFERNRGRYHQNAYNCDEDQTQYRKEFTDSTWKRDHDNFEMYYGNRDNVPPLHREKDTLRPSGKEREASPRRRERSRSRSGSFSDVLSDTDNSSISSFNSSLSSHSRSSYGSSRSPSPSEKKSPDESILSLKCEILKTKSEGRNSRNQSYTQSISHSPVSRASSCSSRGNRSPMPDSSNKDDFSLQVKNFTSKFSVGVKRPLSPEASTVPTKPIHDQNLDNSAKSRREYLLEQLKVVEDAIARKRSKN